MLDFLHYDKNPAIIYHYTSPTGFKGILDNQVLRFTDRFFLNDGSEGVYVLGVLKKHFDVIFPEELIQYKKELVQCLLNFKKEFKEKIPFKVYQLSFSEDGDSLPLWNYYTKGAGIEGYNVKFLSESLGACIKSQIDSKDKDLNLTLYGHRVIYDVEMQVSILKKTMSELYESLVQDSSNKEDTAIVAQRRFVNSFESILGRLIVMGSIFKDPCFTCEKEYRLFVNLYDNDGELYKIEKLGITRQYRYLNGLYIPYIDLPFDYDEIKTISFSPTIQSLDQQKSVKDYVLAKTKNHSIVFMSSKIPIRF